jgi:glucose-1-phosphate cytidylyltransferase
MEPEFLDLIQSDETVLEKEPLETVANKSQLAAFQHDGFWQCMDTIRDRNILEDLWNSNKAPWKK